MDDIRARNSCHRKLTRNPTCLVLRDQHRALRSAAKRLDRFLKNAFFQQQCNSFRGNAKKLWGTINTVTGRRKPAQISQVSLEILSETFASVTNDPARPKKLRPPDAVTRLACPIRLTSFQTIVPSEIAGLCKALHERKATGHNGLPATVLKRCADTLAPSLALLFNKSLSSGIVPSKFKMANIFPFFKGYDVTVASNYRPVSLLPIVSRLLEKFVQQRLMSFLGENHFLPDSQFTYRKNHSTEDAITLAVNRWLLAKYQRRCNSQNIPPV